MLMQTMLNDTKKSIEWSMDGMPGRPPTVYKCAPGKTVDVPAAYVKSGAIARFAPGLVPAPEDPKAAEKEAKAKAKAEKAFKDAAAKEVKAKASALKAAEGKAAEGK